MSKLDTIAKLLHQAENASTTGESVAFMAKVQELASTHSVDLAAARQLTQRQHRTEMPETRMVMIGEPRSWGLSHLVELFRAIALNNDTRFDSLGRLSELKVYGFPTDIDMVETLYLHLARQMVVMGEEYVMGEEWVGETYVRGGRTHQVTYREARKSFYQGFADAINARMYQVRVETERRLARERYTGHEGASTTGALVLRNKRSELRDFYTAESRVSGVLNSRHRPGSRNGARAGDQAGSRAKLRQDPGLNGHKKAIEG